MSVDKKPVEASVPKNDEELQRLLARAKKGDKSTIPALRKLLMEPKWVDNFGGDLARETERYLVTTAAGENLPFKEALSRRLELMREELAGDNPTPLEKLLVERVALCWLTLHDVEMRWAQSRNNLTINQANHWQRRIDHSNKRYLTAIRTLALIRKLAVPVLQVNIAKRQTNIAAGVAVPPETGEEKAS